MSTSQMQEPVLGMPQTQIGAAMLGQVQPVNPGMVGTQQVPTQEQLNMTQPPLSGVPGMAQQMPLNIPGQMPQQQQLPTIVDNNPVAQMPDTAAAQQAAAQQMPAQQAPVQQMPTQQGYPGQMPAQQAPAQQGYPGQAPAQQMPQQGYPGQMPTQQAPGASNQSYLQAQGGMFGPTPTGHPEKTKFQGQAILVHVTNRVTKKGSLMTTGLFNPNPGNRNEAAKSFVCFSGSAANQIEILNNPMIKGQYTNLPQAKGQTIYFEGSWEWDDRAKTPGWKCMMDNFVFVNDQDLRNKAESYVAPVPPSPMDMLNGGNMGMGMMQQQAPQGYGAPMMPMQQAPQGYPGQMPAQQGYIQQMPQQGYPGQMPQQGYPQQQMQGYPGMPGMPGMPGHQ